MKAVQIREYIDVTICGVALAGRQSAGLVPGDGSWRRRDRGRPSPVTPSECRVIAPSSRDPGGPTQVDLTLSESRIVRLPAASGRPAGRAKAPLVFESPCSVARISESCRPLPP